MRPPSTAALLRYVAANVRRLRLVRGLTQEALAEAVGLSTVHLQRIERADVNLRITALVALATALRVPPGHLLRKAAPPERRPGRPRKRVAKGT